MRTTSSEQSPSSSRAAVGPRLRRRWLPAIAATLAFAGIAVAGCGPKTSITQVWSAEVTPSTPPMKKILVMAMRMDEANRRSLEDVFVAELARHGVQGVQAYKLFPQGLPDRAKAEAAVHSIEADGILAANFKGTQERLTYSPGSYAGGFWGGYYGWGYGYSGAYVYTDYIVNLETTLWDARAGDTVVWSALTNTTNPSSGNDFVNSVTEKVIPAIAARGLIPPAPDEKK